MPESEIDVDLLFDEGSGLEKYGSRPFPLEATSMMKESKEEENEVDVDEMCCVDDDLERQGSHCNYPPPIEELVVATLIHETSEDSESLSLSGDDHDTPDALQQAHDIMIVPTTHLEASTSTAATAMLAEAKCANACESAKCALRNRSGRSFVAFLVLLIVVVVGCTIAFATMGTSSNDGPHNKNKGPQPQESLAPHGSVPELEEDISVGEGTAKDNADPSAVSPLSSSEPTLPVEPTASPTLAPTTQLEGYLLSLLSIPATREALSTESSPQHRAFRWLLEDIAATAPGSPTSSDVPLTPYPETRLIQRFALVTFFFATRGIGWQFKQHWLRPWTEIHECEWFTSQDTLSQSPPVCNEDGAYIRLVLIGNILQGTLPPELGYLTELEELKLLGDNFYTQDDQYLQGNIPSEVGLLRNLQLLDISKNGLTGEMPTDFGRLTQLKVLRLLENQLSGSIPSEMLSPPCHHDDQPSMDSCPSLQLEEIRLYSNRLSGTLPTTEWPGLVNSLVTLDWGNNQFHGTLPSELSLLSNTLKTLDLQSNDLTGLIPTELGLLSHSLTFLKLNDNKFSGHMPSELGLLDSLDWLLLAFNRLTGSLPSELGSLIGAGWIVLDHNRLSGTIPTEFGQLSKVRFLRLHENHLMGQVPDEVCTLQANNWWFYLIEVDCNEVSCGCRLCVCA